MKYKLDPLSPNGISPINIQLSSGGTTATSSGGSGDMSASVYDPQGIEGDVFARANHTGTQIASTISDFDAEVGNQADVAANTTARHTHSNKAVLDATTASFLTADETKLDGIEAGAEVNAVDTVNGQTGTVILDAEDVLPSQTGNNGKYLTTNGSVSSWGTLAGGGDMAASMYDPQTIAGDAFDTDNHTDGTTNKVYTATEKTKLSGIATSATANDTDANLKNRANHTGTQLLSTISDVTASASELNKLDGVTATSTELNYTDGVTSAIQTQLNTKVEGSGTDLITVSAVEPATPATGDIWIDETEEFGDLAFRDSPLGPDDVATGIVGAKEDAAGTTGSTSFTPTLGGTPGTNPSVTFVVPASGIIAVTIAALMSINSNTATIRLSFVLSGANTQASSNTTAVRFTPLVTNGTDSGERTFLLTGLTPGSTTATLEYMVTAGTGTFSVRSIIVEPKG